MIKGILSASAVMALSGCLGTLVQVRDAILNPPEPVEMTIPQVNRAAIEQADLAAIMMISPTIGVATVGIAIQMRDGRINYSANDNRGVTLNGGLIYGTLGLGTNLQAVTTQSNDPLVTEARARSWPAEVTRTYHLSQRGTAFTKITMTCRNQVGRELVIDVVGVNRSVVEVVESCTTDTGDSVNNIHYLDAGSGRIWRTSQWTGPVQTNIQVDVIDQFEP
ncbi:group 4 capsule polysaccharide lipoprotein GfcB/YjbF [Yoonia maricola]|uniref:Group 4 capsule polysaccharide lipoprotein GfcB/YjbF n=1 Tax=Yoonia maricola TaxID=420999 RepID=A0A2M8W1Y4_9RHOB|nr:YjbF family lipoprotein [Yoonia maricola]PJI84930.1 group 4 capsule polysaccharide lipoprotein GfcB/YjbF [Yoonia maricola]